MPTLTDKSPMPFGKAHKGKALEDVPASYLLWLYDQIKPKAFNKRYLAENDLLRYIEDNMQVLQKQKKEEFKPYKDR